MFFRFQFRCLALAALACLAVAAQAADAVAYKQIRLGKAVVSLPAQWTSLGPEIPVLLHLHGDRAVVENNFAAIGAPGIIVNITLPGLSKIYADFFADAAVFSDLLRDTEAALRSEAPGQPWRLGALTVSSFSAGFGGVRQLLKQPAAFERIGTLVMADSIYCGYAGDIAEKRVDPELMAGWVRFARLAAEGQRRMAVSHTRQVPEGYASTTETADYLIRELGGARTVVAPESGGPLKIQSRFTRGQLEIFGCDGEKAEDHMRHLRSLSVLLERAFAPPTKSP